MLVKEIKEKFDTEGFTKVEFKKYIPTIQKDLICSEIVDKCMFDENGIKYVDMFLKDTLTSIAIIKNGTDIEFSDDMMECIDELDWLLENDIMNEVSNKLNFSIYDRIYDMIEEEKQKNNSVGAIIAKGIDKLLSKLPDISDIEKIQGMMNDPETMSKIQSIGNIFSGVNGNEIKPNRQQRRAKVKEENKENIEV